MRQLGAISISRASPKLTSLCENCNADGVFGDLVM